MAVRLSDLRNGKAEEKQSGAVRLSDVRNAVNKEQTWSAMTERGNAIMEKAEKEKSKAVEEKVVKQVMKDKGFDIAGSVKTFDTFNKGIQANAEPPLPSYRERVMEKVDKAPQILKPLAAIPAAIEELPFSRAVRQITMPEKTADEPRVGGLAALAASVAVPLTVPGAGLSGTQLYNSAGNMLQRAAPTLGNTLGGRVAGEIVKGGVTGAPLGAGGLLAVNPQATNKELLEAAAYGSGGGVVLGGLTPLIGAGFTKFMNRGKSVTPEVGQAVSSAFEQPQPPRSIDPELPSNPRTEPISQRMSPEEVRYNNLEKEVDSAIEDLRGRYGDDGLKNLDNLLDETEKTRLRQLFKDREEAERAFNAKRESASKNEVASVDSARLSDVRTTVEPPVVESKPVRLNDLKQSKANPVDDVEEILQSVQQPRVRDRVVSFLDEQEKAALARIKSRKNNLSANPLPEWGDHAIVMAAQLGKGTIKAADFTEELVKRFGESVRPHAQAIYRQSKEVLRQQERRASKEGQEAIAFNESGLGDAESASKKIRYDAPNKKTSFAEKWEKIRTETIDDMAPLEGLEKRVRGKLSSAEDSLYKSARMAKGVPEKASQVVTEKLSPIMKMVEDAGHTEKELGLYALMRHAKDVNEAGYKSGFTNAEIDDVLRKYGTPEMQAAQQQLIKVNKDLMKELVDSGVVSKELADVLDDRWKNYVPMFRALDDDKVEFGSGLSDALANVASPIKALKGSEKDVIDPLQNMIKNIFKSTSAAERNKVAGQLAKLASEDVDGQFIRKLDPGDRVDRKNVVNVKVNGENVKYEVEPEVYKALLRLDKESANMVINILSKPASLLRAGATLTPEFSLRNPMRDIVQAFVVSKSGFNPITDFGVGLIQTIKKGDLYKKWVDNLGAYGNVMSMDRDVHKQALQKVLKEPASKKFVNIVSGKSLIKALRYITDTTESATKVGEFRAALRSGVTPQEAAYRSRDIMDFGRAGTSIRQTNKIVAFLNANIQGKSKIIRSIKENPAGTIARAFTAVTVPTVGIFALNKQFANETQQETIKNAPDWMRNSFWLMAIPGTDTVARIPKPFDLATIFSNLPEKALDFVYENDKEAFDGYVSGAMKDMALPTQITGLLPLIEGMANYSFFRDGPIIPQRESGLAFKDQYDPVRTSETAKFLASGMEKLTGGKGGFKNFSSPRIMDNTIQGLTAGLGKYATDAVDSILQGMIPFTGKNVAPAIVDRPVAPEKSIEQQPLLRSFLVDPNQGGKIMEKFYSEKDKLSQEKASNKLNEITFGGTKKSPLYLEKDKEKKLKSMSDTSSDVSDLNKQIRNIEKDKLMTAKEKRRQIDLILEKRKRIIAEVMK